MPLSATSRKGKRTSLHVGGHDARELVGSPQRESRRSKITMASTAVRHIKEGCRCTRTASSLCGLSVLSQMLLLQDPCDTRETPALRCAIQP